MRRICFKTIITIIIFALVVVQAAFAMPGSITVSVTPAAVNAGSSAHISYTLTNIYDGIVIVYVNDSMGNTVRTFDDGIKSSGPHTLDWDGRYANGTVVPDGIYTAHVVVTYREFVNQWGWWGDENGLFKSPFGVAVNSSDYVYVTDVYNNRTQVFDASGNYITRWGSGGSGPGQFYLPVGVAVNSSGYVYVVDYYNDRVQVFDASGNYVAQWGRYGGNPCQFGNPQGLAINSSGYTYVADFTINRVQVFGQEYSASGSSPVVVDNGLPAITCSLDGDKSGQGWFTSDVRVTLARTDGLSGIGSTEYSLDGSSWHTYTGTFTIPLGRQMMIYYRSTDNAGNTVSGSQFIYFPPASIDQTGMVNGTLGVSDPTPIPTITSTITPTPTLAPTPTVTPTATMAPSPGPETGNGASVWLYLGILALIAIVAGAGYYLLARK